MQKKQSPSLFPRFINHKGAINVVRKGSSHNHWGDLYHLLLNLSWFGFLGIIGFIYLTSNAIFALLYLAGGDCIANAKSGAFSDAFFFSVQTMATIGYGGMYPRTVYANIIVTIEAVVGLMGVAMVTGLGFARFSIPTAKVLFSNVAIITTYNGLQTLMFRAANQRHNQIVEAQMRMTLVRNEVTTEGKFMRRLHDLKLVRSRTPIFSLSWTVMHIIDEHSPLYEMTKSQLEAEEIELAVTMLGLDETVSQTIHARYSYLASEIRWNVHFVDILSKTSDGNRIIDYTRFHDVVNS